MLFKFTLSTITYKCKPLKDNIIIERKKMYAVLSLIHQRQRESVYFVPKGIL